MNIYKYLKLIRRKNSFIRILHFSVEINKVKFGEIRNDKLVNPEKLNWMSTKRSKELKGNSTRRNWGMRDNEQRKNSTFNR